MLQLTMAHDLLCDSVDLHNASFSIQFFFNLTNTMIAFLFSTYNFGNMYMTNTLNSRGMMISMVFFNFSMFFFYFINCLVVSSALVKLASSKTASCLQRSLELESRSVNLANTYNLQLQHRSAQISTGLFDCDLTLIYTVSKPELSLKFVVNFINFS